MTRPPLPENDEHWMRHALAIADEAGKAGEIPIGALIVDANGSLLGEGANHCERQRNPTAHAEMIALGAALGVVANQRLVGAVLYCTVEPCPMCAGAIVLARASRVVFGCRQPKFGGVVSGFGVGTDARMNHRFEVTEGVLAEECAQRLHAFFQSRRG